jgi:hypothetical protein
MPERIRIQREYHVRAPEKSFFFEKDLKRHPLPLSCAQTYFPRRKRNEKTHHHHCSQRLPLDLTSR